MQRRTLLMLGGAVVLVGGWYLFRPERLFINQTVAESFPAAAATTTAEPVAVLSGQFHSNAHETMGRATVYRFPDGRLVLRLTEFETSNGPDVQVYLVAAPDVNENDEVKRAGFVNLGAMKGNVGDQNYDIPAGTDLSTFRSVSIWCRRFSVNFGAAPLS